MSDAPFTLAPEMEKGVIAYHDEGSNSVFFPITVNTHSPDVNLGLLVNHRFCQGLVPNNWGVASGIVCVKDASTQGILSSRYGQTLSQQTLSVADQESGHYQTVPISVWSVFFRRSYNENWRQEFGSHQASGLTIRIQLQADTGRGIATPDLDRCVTLDGRNVELAIHGKNGEKLKSIAKAVVKDGSASFCLAEYYYDYKDVSGNARNLGRLNPLEQTMQLHVDGLQDPPFVGYESGNVISITARNRQGHPSRNVGYEFYPTPKAPSCFAIPKHLTVNAKVADGRIVADNRVEVALREKIGRLVSVISTSISRNNKRLATIQSELLAYAEMSGNDPDIQGAITDLKNEQRELQQETESLLEALSD